MEEELCFRALWKRFYETVAIRERENPRCQNTFLPKRYRGTMTEFLPLDYERQQQNLPSSHDVANGAIIRMIDSIELPLPPVYRNTLYSFRTGREEENLLQMDNLQDTRSPLTWVHILLRFALTLRCQQT